MDMGIEPDPTNSTMYFQIPFIAPTPNDMITLGTKRVILQRQQNGEIAWIVYPVDRTRIRRMTANSPSTSHIRVIVLWWHVRLWRWLKGYR